MLKHGINSVITQEDISCCCVTTWSCTRRQADRQSAVMSGGEVSFVDFLLGIALYPRYSRFTEHDSSSELVGPETNHWITVSRYGCHCCSGGDGPASAVICSPTDISWQDRRRLVMRTARCARASLHNERLGIRSFVIGTTRFYHIIRLQHVAMIFHCNRCVL